MSISSFLGLETALRGLQAHQSALDVTTHNVANASTQGYTRQEAVLSATNALVLPTGQTAAGGAAMLGQGVDVQAFNRIRDQFADLQYRAQNQSLGSSQTNANILGQVQDVLSEPSEDGISEVMSKFWDSWDAYSNNPENPATGQAVLNQAQLLTDRINQLSKQMGDVQTQAQQQYAQDTGPNGDVLKAANQIAQLNMAIKSAVGQGGQPNDLLDARDKALDTLSAYAQVKVTDAGDGTVTVNFGDAGQPLVSGSTVTWPQALTSAAGGSLGSLLQLGDPTTGTIAGFMNQVDGFASTLATTVNTAYNGTFFSGTTGGTLAVAETPATLRASTTTGAASGVNDAALAVAALRGGAADSNYSALVAGIGGAVSSAQNQQATAQALVSAAQDRRESTSGVSLDEEMSNMIRFQRGYQASARVMTTLDQMLDTLINRTGV
jgi:flagellar hook-associated protein 1 FlgK